MKKRKLILLLAFVAICTVACILILDVAREEDVATIELPPGDCQVSMVRYIAPYS